MKQNQLDNKASDTMPEAMCTQDSLCFLKDKDMNLSYLRSTLNQAGKEFVQSSVQHTKAALNLR